MFQATYFVFPRNFNNFVLPLTKTTTMKKNTFLFLLGIFSFFQPQAQKWDSVAHGVTTYGWIGALRVYKNTLYAGGGFDSAAGTIANEIASWNGTAWNTVDKGARGYGNTIVNALGQYNNQLIVGGGDFDTVGNVVASDIATWNGAAWDSIGSGINQSPFSNAVYAIDSMNGDLYAGGWFDSIGKKIMNNIAMWNGTTWSALTSGVNGANTSVYAMIVYNGKLVVAGSFSTAGGNPANNIAQWDGTTWSTLGSGTNGPGIFALTVYKGNLIVAGHFSTAGGNPANSIAQWNGTSWSSLGSGLKYYGDGWVDALAVYNNKLYAGGEFDSAGSIKVNNIAQWDGTSWSDLGSGIGIVNDTNGVYALAVYNGALYAGGQFQSAGGVAVNNIAVWTAPLGVNELESTNAEITVYPNPSNGVFTVEVKSEELRTKSVAEVYNMLGEKVASLPSQGGFNTQIDLSKEASGIYFYRIVSETGNLLGEGKLIKE
jgi:hypothetical protein